MTESAVSAAPERAPSPPEITLGQDVKAGLMAMGIAVLCLLPPGIHFVTGPLGPAIGGFLVAFTNPNAQAKKPAPASAPAEFRR